MNAAGSQAQHVTGKTFPLVSGLIENALHINPRAGVKDEVCQNIMSLESSCCLVHFATRKDVDFGGFNAIAILQGPVRFRLFVFWDFFRFKLISIFHCRELLGLGRSGGSSQIRENTSRTNPFPLAIIGQV